MADKQLILVVEGTAAMGPYWKTIVSDYLDKIIRSFCSNDMITQIQKPTSIVSGSTFELALVVFNTHGPYSGSLVQRSGWTRDMDNFLSWLSSITFCGGGWNDVATAEGLAEALMMFAIPQNGYRAEQNLDGKRHCILVSASNPYPLPTPVYRPAIENPEQGESGEAQTENLLYDAETVSKWFGLCSVSLSVICPKPLPKLKALYNAGKRNQMATDPAVDVKQPHYSVQISDSFMEALAALSRSGLAQSQNPATTSPPGSAPPSVSPVNGYIMNRPSVSAGNVPQATVKMEPSTVTSMASGPAIPHMPSIPRAAAQSVPSLQASSPPSVSQEPTTTNENVPDLKPIISSCISQPVRPVGAILNNISQARVALAGGTSLGLPSMGGNTIGMHMSNMISNGMTSNVPPSQTVLSSGQSGISTVTGSGSIAGASQPLQNSALGSFSTATSNVSGNSNLGISQPLTNLQGNVSNTMGQPISGIGQGNVSAMTQSGTNMNPNMMSNLGSTGAPSGTGSMMPTPGMPQQVQPGMQSIGVNNSAANMPMSQQATASLQSSQSKYVKVWEGNLSGQRQGQPVFITRLEGYRNASASETLAANWPPTMQIVRLISQDHMNNKQYVGKADFLVFRAMNQHGFLAQLQEKKLCAVIQLPTQTLLLSVSDKACRLIGMLFPGDMVIFKPQIPSQQQQLQHQQQQNQQLQHQQQQNQQMQQQNQQMQQQQSQQQQQQQPHSQLQPQQLQHMQQQQTMQQLQQQQQLPQMQQSQLQHLPQQQSMQHLQQQQQIPQLQQQQIPQLQQQQQIPQLQQQQQIPQLQQQQQLQQLQQQSQPQQMVGAGMGQGYMQGPGRPQLVPQGQVPSQGTQPNMSGGGFMG
ncbi:mediator of RNA polymerase II transcription subunit 25-like isoform X1 [Chenopodium quinoa]|uniref:mediator of RNA polymerase II transcription subunit 25-like isoform X1 n=1 Tax=Chenopodium quinoa TaxID=63459 RepID=UPI000B796568|nr:mediator of RNA polymerase II transcription subunit 25-like isoform X1 [Chenopodium quinoa]